jgi:hypothetical protein
MAPHDDEMERYLKEFRPKAIRKLAAATQPRNILWRRLAAAAVVVMCAGGGLFWSSRCELTRSREAANVPAPKVVVARRRRYPTTLALTKLALADSEKFDSLLAETSRKSLPGFQGEQSTLKVLAKD